MKTQFFYTRKEGINPKEGETEVTYREFVDSFNVNKVIRTVHMEDDTLLVLLDDIHERSQDVPDIDLKTNKMKGTKRIRNSFQSEIILSKEDRERFFIQFN